MNNTRDIATLAKRAYELSILTPAELQARYVEAQLVISAIVQAATVNGVAAMEANKLERWPELKDAGIIAAVHPKWLLFSNNGKPPAIQIALDSALTNPSRTLLARLHALQLVAPADREALSDLPRALATDAYNNAYEGAQLEYVDEMRATGGPFWFKQPWLTVLPNGVLPAPVRILIEHQKIPGDPVNAVFDKLRDAINGWDGEFLRDNPFAKFYTWAHDTAGDAADAGLGLLGTATVLGAGYLAIKLLSVLRSKRD
jgi:hypothetical protein